MAYRGVGEPPVENENALLRRFRKRVRVYRWCAFVGLALLILASLAARQGALDGGALTAVLLAGYSLIAIFLPTETVDFRRVADRTGIEGPGALGPFTDVLLVAVVGIIVWTTAAA